VFDIVMMSLNKYPTLSFGESKKRMGQLTYWFVFAFLVLLLKSCAPPQPQREFSGDKTFRTTQPSRLFFANTRAHTYYRNRPKGTDLDVYRFRKFQHTRKRPMLIPIIVDAYLKDEAYLFIEANKYPDLSDPLTFEVKSKTQTDTFRLDLPSRKAQLEFATDLYEAVLNGHHIGVMVRDTGFHPILEKRAERAAFQAVVKDYYRLTERI